MTTRRTIQARDRAVLRRREILEAARHKISANGIIDVSMKRVALLAGCSVGTLYTYFGSRDELLYDAYQHYAQREYDIAHEQLAAASDPNPGRRASRLAEAFVRRTLCDPSMAASMMFRPAPSSIESVRRTSHNIFSCAIATAIAGHPPNRYEHMMGRALVGLINVILQEPLYDAPCSFSTAERRAFADQITHLCLRATGENC